MQPRELQLVGAFSSCVFPYIFDDLSSKLISVIKKPSPTDIENDWIIFSEDPLNLCVHHVRKSLIQQLLYCYGANRRAQQPVQLVFSGVEEGDWATDV